MIKKRFYYSLVKKVMLIGTFTLQKYENTICIMNLLTERYVTPTIQVYATGYGAGGRLGIGGTESISTPTLLESIQHVFIKKIAVNSGGKHCLALSAEGEVYSWGEGEDGKLGHGNRR